MADNVKGEVVFEADGQSYILVYSINALVKLEDALDMSVVEIGKKMGEAMRLGFLRKVFWAGLLTHHKGLTEEAAGDLVQALGGGQAGALIGQAFAAAFGGQAAPAEGESAGGEAAEGKPRPRKPAAGTGATS